MKYMDYSPGPIFAFITIRKVALSELIRCAFSIIPKREFIGFVFYWVFLVVLLVNEFFPSEGYIIVGI